MPKTVYKKHGNKKNLFGYVKILTAFFLIFSLGCCGKKGPPIPPEMLPLPPAIGLEANLLNKVLHLNWNVQTDKGVPSPDGFRIYRSKISMIEFEECPGCPDAFEKVSELPTAFSLWGLKETRFNYRETLEDGYAYRYKVMAYTDGGLTSDWSDTVEVVIDRKTSDTEN